MNNSQQTARVGLFFLLPKIDLQNPRFKHLETQP